MQEAAGGDRNTPEDFAQLRAFDLERIPFASHTSLLLDRRVAHRSELWAMRALFPNVATETLALNVDLATYETFNVGRRRLAGALLGLIGLDPTFSACGQRCGPAIRSNISNCRRPGGFRTDDRFT